MSVSPTRFLIRACAIATLACLVVFNATHAQDGSHHRGSHLQSAQKTDGSQSVEVGLSGYCPVCIIKMRKWVKGSPEHQAIYDGKAYYFPGEKQKQMFLSDPAKFVPALGGDCTVCLAKMGKRAPGSVQFSAIRDQRLFLFPSVDQKNEFIANPISYANIDSAMNGQCVVCKTEMGKEVPGKPEFAAIHQGKRYLFPGAKQREMFLANPAKYTVINDSASRTRKQRPAVVGNAKRLVNLVGTSSCAGCDYGVAPIGAPNELGLAIETNNGVVVVENAHTLYPNIYNARFDGISLEVNGEVVKTDGKFTWVAPRSVKVVN